MTRPTDPGLLHTVLQLLTDQGHAGFAEGLRRLVNQAILVERAQAIQAQPYERTPARQGHANGFKDKTLTTRLGAMTFDVPQVRGDVAFYPAAFQKGLRSAQALKLALAERYVQGVSTRKVSALVELLCGTTVRSTQVSACAKLLDAELTRWRERPLGSFAYLVVDGRSDALRKTVPSGAKLGKQAADTMRLACRRDRRARSASSGAEPQQRRVWSRRPAPAP